MLQLDAAERDYFISLLKSRQATIAKGLVARLRECEDVFGVVAWSDTDIADELIEQAVPDTPENIRAVRGSYHGRRIGDLMVDYGWNVLRDAVASLKA